MSEPIIRLQRLSIAHQQGYSRRTVVQDINLTVATGECFGLVGPSGCGKSSLLWVLAGLNPHWQGQMRLLGRDLVPGQPFTGVLRREVQMVFQVPYSSLHPKHKLMRTLAEPLKLLKERDIGDKILAGFRQVGLDAALVDRYPHQLSGGQRQRVAIVCARLLLLDEPTSALDMSVQAEILNLLNELKQRGDLTLVLVSHDRDVIDHLCDRAATMAQGVIVDGGDYTSYIIKRLPSRPAPKAATLSRRSAAG